MTCVLASCLLSLAPSLAVNGVARYAAGDPPTEEHVRFIRMAPIDGNPRGETHAAKVCLRTDRETGNPYIYFDVSRTWLRNFGHEPYALEATIEFFDEGKETVAVQYDAMGNEVTDNYREVSWNRTDTGTWRMHTVRLDMAQCRNSQHGRADLRLAAAPGTDLRVATIEIKVVSASATAPVLPPTPERKLPIRHEADIRLDSVRIVAASGLSESERIALARFRERLQAVGAREGKDGPSLVVGRWNARLAARYPRTAVAIRRLAADKTAFRRRDGYVIVVERWNPATVCAVALASQGSVFAIGDLHTRALRDGSKATLKAPLVPRIEAPALDRRELYLNIGYGLRRPAITVESWTDTDWRQYIDGLILARYNTWSFYLWGDCAMLHPAAIANRDLNLRVHRALREAIRYSHRRGMKVGLQFTPTMVPLEIWKEHPSIQAKLEYVYPGTVCPSREETWAWMLEVQKREIEWFGECDFFSLWYYDVGGCFCETCRVGDTQLGLILRQAQTFAPIARRANPRATFQVMAWAIWRYERMHGYSIRDRFIASLRQWFAEQSIPLEMADGIFVDPGTEPVFAAIRREQLPGKAFLYQTNIETGQPLPIMQTRYLARWVPEIVRAGATSAFLMRMEAGTKQSDDCVAGRYLWEPRVRAEEAILDCARRFVGDVNGSRVAWEALCRIDDFAWFGRVGGSAGARQGAQIAAHASRAVEASPEPLRRDLEWLKGAGPAYAVLGQAVDARDDEDEDAVGALDPAFTSAMRASPLYRGQADDAPYWRDLFRSSLVRFFYSGWGTYHF